jgi:hypothetical protein|tara:strand:+ start:49 stop:993 length:945 start_codon:yes stop_codon:yes gene_type:complete
MKLIKELIESKDYDLNKEYRIAVMLNGHPKHLNITSKFYSVYNDLYENVTFDFYISIWDTIDNAYESFDPIIDLSKEKWITKYELLKEEDCPFDLKNYNPGRHQPHYCWTLKKVNELRNTSNIEYDAVIQTRCDFILSKRLLDKVVYNIIRKQFNDIILYAKNPVSAHNEDAWVQDFFFVSKPKPMDALAEMFDDIFGKNVNYDMENYEGPVLMHCLQPYHLMKRGIHISGLRLGAGLLIRESYRFNEDMSLETTSITVGNNTIKQQANTNTGWQKANPSDGQILRLLEEKGPIWILDPENQRELRSYIENTEK